MGILGISSILFTGTLSIAALYWRYREADPGDIVPGEPCIAPVSCMTHNGGN